MPRIVCTMGACGAGKSTLAKAYVNSYHRDTGTVIAFADVLKQVAKEEGGWNGVKDEAGRVFIQDFSEEYKRKHGDDIFTRLAFKQALAYDGSLVILEDVRFNLEIKQALALRRYGVPLTLFLVHNTVAENRWRSAYARYLAGDETCKWAGHRSELEWRAFLSLWKNKLVFENDFIFGAPSMDCNDYKKFVENCFEDTTYDYDF